MLKSHNVMSFRAISQQAGRGVASTAITLAAACILQSSVGAQVTVSPTQLQFAAQAVGTRSTAQTITLTINTSAPVQIGAVLQGPEALNLQDSTATAVIDSGNSNPDSDFRFDTTIGGSGGYTFNLSTKNLTSGRYSLSMYVGPDRQNVYTSRSN